jgi:FAD/FMN-containing dehydrogenase
MPVKEELSNLLDPGRVFDGAEALEPFVHNTHFVKGAMPECVVRPKNTDEIQEIVRWANDSKTPLIPVSSGAPHARGSSTALLGGVAMDLSEMNRILAVDRDYRAAMVEPGVTFHQLKPELEKAGLRIPMPLSPRKSKSVMAAVLEREPVTIPKYHIDMSAPLLCAEVVFGTGDIFRTGEASGPGTVEEQLQVQRKQVWDSGPGQISFSRLLQAAQGTLGVVTWCTLRCEVLPSAREFMFLGGESIGDFTDFVYRVMRLKLGDECFILNNANAALLMADTSQADRIRKSLPPWLLVLGVAGYEYFPEERIAYQKKDLFALARGSGLVPQPIIPGGNTRAFLDSLEAPTEPFWKFKLRGGCADIFFLTTIERVPHFVNLMQGLCNQHQYAMKDLGVYVQPIQQGRNCHCEFNLPYDPDDSEESEQVKCLFSAAGELMLREGAFFSRPYGEWAEMVYGRDAVTRESIAKLKAIFDPRNIMNPGKLC